MLGGEHPVQGWMVRSRRGVNVSFCYCMKIYKCPRVGCKVISGGRCLLENTARERRSTWNSELDTKKKVGGDISGLLIGG